MTELGQKGQCCVDTVLAADALIVGAGKGAVGSTAPLPRFLPLRMGGRMTGACCAAADLLAVAMLAGVAMLGAAGGGSFVAASKATSSTTERSACTHGRRLSPCGLLTGAVVVSSLMTRDKQVIEQQLYIMHGYDVQCQARLNVSGSETPRGGELSIALHPRHSEDRACCHASCACWCHPGAQVVQQTAARHALRQSQD